MMTAGDFGFPVSLVGAVGYEEARASMSPAPSQAVVAAADALLKELVCDLLTVDGKGREAKRKALCQLLEIMDASQKEELIIYIKQYRANPPPAVAPSKEGM